MIGLGIRFGVIPNYPARGDLAVACPHCKSEAVFTSPYDFLRDDAAEAACSDARITGVKWSGGFAVERFPDTFPWKDPNNPYVQVVRNEVWGVLSCGKCGHRRKHLLNWPADAFYVIETSAGALWAYTREHLVQIRQRISGESSGGPFDMNRLPRQFLLKRTQARLLREIDAFLLRDH